MKSFQGTIVEESLTDNRILNQLKILGLEISTEENPEERWHIFQVTVLPDQIQTLSELIKPGWYMHFWHKNEIIAVFSGKTFFMDAKDKSTWQPAIEYGLKAGIPAEQLDFKII